MQAITTLPYIPRPPSPKTRPKTANAYREARDLQQLVMTAARDKDAKGVSLASLARAWMDLERLRRDMRMLPKPKPIDVVPRSRAKSNSYSDPTARTTPPKRTTIAQVVPQPSTTTPNTAEPSTTGQPTPTEP